VTKSNPQNCKNRSSKSAYDLCTASVHNNTQNSSSGSIESVQNISCFFLFCNIYTETGYYKKEMSHLFANFPG